MMTPDTWVQQAIANNPRWLVERTLRDAQAQQRKELLARVPVKFRGTMRRALNDWDRRRGFML